MTFLDFEIDEKDLAAAKLIGDTRRALVAALLEAKREDPSMCQAELARRIKMDKGSLSRLLNGRENMTLRTIGEIGWALGLEPHFSLDQTNGRTRSNSKMSYASGHGNVEHTSWDASNKPFGKVKVSHVVQKLSLANAS